MDSGDMVYCKYGELLEYFIPGSSRYKVEVNMLNCYLLLANKK